MDKFIYIVGRKADNAKFIQTEEEKSLWTENNDIWYFIKHRNTFIGPPPFALSWNQFVGNCNCTCTCTCTCNCECSEELIAVHTSMK